MKRIARTKKSYSRWWDSHIHPKNSKWSTLEEMNGCVEGNDYKHAISDGDSSTLHQRIFYEYEEKHFHNRDEHLKNGDHIDFTSKIPALEKLMEADDEICVVDDMILNMKQGLEEKKEEVKHMCIENRVLELEELNDVLEVKISLNKQKIENLKSALVSVNQQFEADISRRDDAFEVLKTEFSSLSQTYLNEKIYLEGIIANLEGSIGNLKEEIKQFSEEGSLLARKDIDRDFFIRELQANAATSAEQYLHEKIHLEGIIANQESSIGNLKEKIKQFSEENSLLVRKDIDQGFLIRELQANAATSAEQYLLEKTHLEGIIANLEGSISNIKEERKQFSEENSLLARKDIDQGFLIRELQANVATSAEQHLHEKTHLEGIIANLENLIGVLKQEIKMISEDGSLLERKQKHIDQDGLILELQANATTSAEQYSKEKCELEARLSGLSFSHDSLEAEVVSLVSEIRDLRAVSAQQLEEHSRNLNTVKLYVDRLSIEREELVAKLTVLIIDVKSRDERLYELNEHLHHLNLEHVKLITELDESQKEAVGLRSTARELEEEVDRQRVMIADSAEGKREAIRQLCFSLEYYQEGYRQLRLVLQAHKWPAVVAS